VLISALAQILGLTTEHHSICTIPNGVLQVANLSYGGQAAAKLPLRNLWEASHMSGLPMIYNDLPAGRHIYIYIHTQQVRSSGVVHFVQTGILLGDGNCLA